VVGNSSCPGTKGQRRPQVALLRITQLCRAPNLSLHAKGSPEPVRTATGAGGGSEAGLFRDRRYIRVVPGQAWPRLAWIGKGGGVAMHEQAGSREAEGDEIDPWRWSCYARRFSGSPSRARTVALFGKSAKAKREKDASPNSPVGVKNQPLLCLVPRKVSKIFHWRTSHRILWYKHWVLNIVKKYN